jgi:hypothetical protein
LKIYATTVEKKGNLGRGSVQDIYIHIIADFTEAEENLRDKDEQEVGFPNKWAATAYLAKVYVQMECLTDDHFEASNDKGKIGADGYVGSANEFANAFIPNELKSNYSINYPQKYFWEKAVEKSEK